MKVVAYKGAADAIGDVLAGDVPMICDVVLPTGNDVKAGRIRAWTFPRPSVPGVPGCADGGRARHARHGERGVLRLGGAGRRAGADRRAAERLVRRIIADPEVKKKVADLGYFTTADTPRPISRS